MPSRMPHRLAYWADEQMGCAADHGKPSGGFVRVINRAVDAAMPPEIFTSRDAQ